MADPETTMADPETEKVQKHTDPVPHNEYRDKLRKRLTAEIKTVR
jgi:hypothetical protein